MVIGGQGVVTPFCFQNSVDKMSSELGYFYSRAIFCGSLVKVEASYYKVFSGSVLNVGIISINYDLAESFG